MQLEMNCNSSLSGTSSIPFTCILDSCPCLLFLNDHFDSFVLTKILKSQKLCQLDRAISYVYQLPHDMNKTLKALAKMILWMYILNEKDLGCYCFRKVVHHKTNYKKIMEKWWRISWVGEKGKMTTQKTFAYPRGPNKRNGCWLN